MRWRHRVAVSLFLSLLLLAGATSTAFGWGPEGHKIINAQAMENLPEPLRSYFLEHSDFIQQNALAADERKSLDPDESPRHYIDLDYYDEYPFEKVSHNLDELIAQYGELTVKRWGLLPWAIAQTLEKLTAQMKAGDEGMWLTAADLAHYIGDAHQPFHTTKDYDGRDSRTKGIHERFEIALVSFFWEEEGAGQLEPLQAIYIDDPLETAFKIVIASYRWVEPLLEADIAAQKVGSKHSLSKEGYWRAFWDGGGGKCMVERFNEAAFYVASFWYTAWVDAGKPDLAKAQAEEGLSLPQPRPALALTLALVLAVLLFALVVALK